MWAVNLQFLKGAGWCGSTHQFKPPTPPAVRLCELPEGDLPPNFGCDDATECPLNKFIGQDFRVKVES